PCQTGPTAWMTNRAGNPKPGVSAAPPVGQRPIAAQAFASAGPALRWIAPHTPPPGARDSFAALTMASTSRLVMSPRRIWMRGVRGSGMVLAPSGWKPNPYVRTLQLHSSARRHPRVVRIGQPYGHTDAPLQHRADRPGAGDPALRRGQAR